MTPEKIVELMGDRDFGGIWNVRSGHQIRFFRTLATGRMETNLVKPTVAECFQPFAEHVKERDSVTPEEIVRLMTHKRFRRVNSYIGDEVSVEYECPKNNRRNETKPGAPQEAFSEFKRAISSEAARERKDKQ